MTEIKAGDIVTYRPKQTRPDFMPMGLSGCEVKEIWETNFGEPAATIVAFGEELHVPRDTLVIEG